MATEDIGGMARAALPLTEGLAKLCIKLLSEPADVAGQFLAEWSKSKFDNWKAKNLLSILEKADKKIPNGTDSKEIPKRMLHDLFEGASFEDNEDLQEVWACLLASVLQGKSFHIAYPDILRQLSPAEAKILNALFLSGTSALTASPKVTVRQAVPLHTFLSQDAMTEELLLISTENICRLNLCTLEPAASLLETYESALGTPYAKPPQIPQVR